MFKKLTDILCIPMVLILLHHTGYISEYGLCAAWYKYLLKHKVHYCKFLIKGEELMSA